jgi:hypothetical protein
MWPIYPRVYCFYWCHTAHYRHQHLIWQSIKYTPEIVPSVPRPPPPGGYLHALCIDPKMTSQPKFGDLTTNWEAFLDPSNHTAQFMDILENHLAIMEYTNGTCSWPSYLSLYPSSEAYEEPLTSSRLEYSDITCTNPIFCPTKSASPESYLGDVLQAYNIETFWHIIFGYHLGDPTILVYILPFVYLVYRWCILKLNENFFYYWTYANILSTIVAIRWFCLQKRLYGAYPWQ